MSALISVVVPVYNVEKYLDQCLESVFNQTFKDLEVIIVNDGSSDNSIEVIDRFKKKHSNILYLEQENKGLSEARNVATRYAKGEYIIYIDSDDFIHLNMLELMYKKAKEINADVIICGHREIYEKGSMEHVCSSVLLEVDPSKVYSGNEVGEMLLNCKVLGVTWNKLFKRELIEKHGLYFEPGRYTQDWYPIFKLISKCCSIGFVNKALYNYRIRLGSTTTQKNSKRLNDYSHAVLSILEYVKSNENFYSEKSIKRFKAITFESCISMYLELSMGKKETNFYKNFFSYTNFNFNISFKNLLLSELGIRRKLNLLLWNIKLIHKFYKIKIG